MSKENDTGEKIEGSKATERKKFPWKSILIVFAIIGALRQIGYSPGQLISRLIERLS